jgi:hypothetical protein
LTLSTKSAQYLYQPEVQRKDSIVGKAMDDIASQIDQVRQQGNFGQKGPPPAPHPITSINVSSDANGFATISLTHNSAPVGARYIVYASSTPNFQNPIRIAELAMDDGGTTVTTQAYFKGQGTLYFRGAPKFPSSDLAPWTYFGSQAQPQGVSF